MTQPKQYEIDSLEKLVNVVTAENMDMVATDLVMWLAYVVQMFSKIRKDNPRYAKGKSNWDLCKCTFIWIDDGKNDMKEIVIKNQLTGEIKTFTLNSKK